MELDTFRVIQLEQQLAEVIRINSMFCSQVRNALVDIEDGNIDSATETLNAIVGNIGES